MAFELLSDDETAELEQEARRVIEQHASAATSPEACEELARCLASDGEEAYVSARVAGLCREGALELFTDAVRAALERGATPDRAA
ncbi:MAG: hypothetical protein GEU80_04550 [Dehalococcoidia bacterium]|nr:hypothetical protein [Dehalococcoidia bacterium]